MSNSQPLSIIFSQIPRELSSIMKKNLATIAIVGENIKQSHNLDNQLYKALEINNIKIFAYSPASSKINIAISVKADDLHKAMSLTHNFFF